MTIVFNIFVALHFVGLALLLGGWVVQVRNADKGVSRWMLDGALTQLITGIVMVGIISSKVLGEDETVDNTKIAVKLLIAIAITVLAIIGRRRPAPQQGLWAVIGAMTIFNLLVAVFW